MATETNPYGCCPICGAKGIMRERRPDGNDRCSAGHTYPSRNSVGEVRPQPPAKCPTCGRPNEVVKVGGDVATR